uniref:Uncharacterized protein n=1 Tax=Arundo donax TaxID=35708 RepID=A0A0A9AFK7_ARUDO
MCDEAYNERKMRTLVAKVHGFIISGITFLKYTHIERHH